MLANLWVVATQQALIPARALEMLRDVVSLSPRDLLGQGRGHAWPHFRASLGQPVIARSAANAAPEGAFQPPV